LLEFTRAELESWASEQGIDWIDDPSNADPSLDRNFLRARITPLLQERWPAAASNAARSAAHLQEADRVLRALAQADLASIRAGECLHVAGWSALEPARRRNALRHWMRERGARVPSTRRLAAIEHDMLAAAPDRIPCISWDDVELRRYRGLLHLDRRLPKIEEATVPWPPGAVLELPGELGSLALIRDSAGALSRRRLSPTLHRGGGERIRPAGRTHQRHLKKMLQAAGVPPWRRGRLPLIYSDDRLAAVGDLWVAEEFAASDAEDALRIVWSRGAG
jgi:tRNA(Ile)-lysidine synthase